MPKTMSFADVGATPTDRLTAELKAWEDGYREAMQGLCCVVGRLRAIPPCDALAPLGTVSDEFDVEGPLPETMRRVHDLQARVFALLGVLDGITDEWAMEGVYAEIAFREAAIEEALKSAAAKAAAEESAWAQDRASGY